MRTFNSEHCALKARVQSPQMVQVAHDLGLSGSDLSGDSFLIRHYRRIVGKPTVSVKRWNDEAAIEAA